MPAAAVLLIGAYGSQIVPQDHAIIFTILFLLASVATFMGEQKINSYIQEIQGRRYLELAEVCHAFLGGNWALRITIQEESELSELAEAINLLLEKQRQLLQHPHVPPTPQTPPPTPRPAPSTPIRQSHNNDLTLFKEQLTLIIRELAPVAEGDLRVRVSLSDDLVGIIADACNSFIEELAQFVKWTRYASQVVTTASQSILGRSIEMAKSAEDQMQQIAKTTDSMEKIVVFMQHLGNTFHLNSAMAKELQSDVREHMHDTNSTSLERLLDESQRQIESFDDMLTALETVSTLAESLIGDLYTLAQQTYQSSVSALKTVKRLRELEALAQHWYEMTEVFTIEENEATNEIKEPWLL